MRPIVLILSFLFLALTGSRAQCTSDAGTWVWPWQELCEAQAMNFAAFYNENSLNDQVLDADDVLAFYYQDGFDQLNPNVAIAFLPDVFQDLQIPLPGGQIFAVVGNDDGSGFPDFNDPCVTISDSPLQLLVYPQSFVEIEVSDEDCGAEEVTLTAVINGGPNLPDEQFFWSTGDNTESIVVTDPGFYSVLVFDQFGCDAWNGVTVDFGTPVDASIQGPSTFSCTDEVQVFEVVVTGGTPPFNYNWNIAGCDGSPTCVTTGTEFLSVVITGDDGCSTSLTKTIAEADLLPVSIDSTSIISCDDPIGFVYGSFQPGVALAQFELNAPWPVSFPTDSTFIIEVSDNLPYELDWAYGDGSICQSGTTPYQVDYAPNGCAVITGTVLRDQNDDCLPDGTDTPLAERLVRGIGGSQTRLQFTDDDGNFELYLPANEIVELEIVSSHTLFENCDQPLIITTPGVGESINVALLQQPLEDCALLDVQFSAGIVRRCFEVPFYVEVCNLGVSTATTAYVDIQLDPLFVNVTSAVPLIDLGGNLYRVELGDLAEQECFDFSIQTDLQCAAQLGQTLCNEAHVFPNDPCPPPGADWNGASVAISGDCENGQNRFIIENVGTGDMVVPSEYIVIEDGVVLMQIPESFTLPAGESLEVLYEANGSTFRLEATQVPNHPGGGFPSYTIEGCGTNDAGDFSTGYLLQFAQDELNQTVDIECRQVIGAYDPNDKTAFPRGYTDQHFIEANTPLEYLIRFQNTGTDTAFNVYIEDVIDPALDLTTLRPLISSHDYRVEFVNGDTVHFVFDDILLVDSFTNEAGSHGFIRFAIEQEADLPIGTIIEGKAGIYFDFNEPVLTNTVFHTVETKFLEYTSTQEIFLPGVTVTSFPNPATDRWHLELTGADLSQARFELRDLNGRTVRRQALRSSMFSTDLSGLQSGVYFYRVLRPDGVLVAGKLVIGN